MNLVLIFFILSMVVNIILVFDSKQLFKKLKAEQEKVDWLVFSANEQQSIIEYYERILEKIRSLT